MAALSQDALRELLVPYDDAPSALLLDQLSVYLDLLLKWNARMNLTAVRDPEEMVRVHFGESLFCARHLPEACTLLDFGSGAGFPGLPIQLARPGLQVTLTESQGKKAAFLREAVRVLGLSTEVWGGRVESLEGARRFDVVTLRAVDDPAKALKLARARVKAGGTLAQLTSGAPDLRGEVVEIPGSRARVLVMERLD